MEDVRLAERVKGAGAHMMMERAPSLLRTRMYTTFSEMWECSTKNWFSGVNFSFGFALLCVVSMYLGAVAPALIGLAAIGALVLGINAQLSALIVLAALAWLLQALVLAVVSRRSGVSPLYAFTAPLGVALIYAMLFDSGVRITTGKGVTWKGRRHLRPAWGPAASNARGRGSRDKKNLLKNRKAIYHAANPKHSPRLVKEYSPVQPRRQR